MSHSSFSGAAGWEASHFTVVAEYLGGDPDVAEPTGAGKLTLDPGGEIGFAGSRMLTSLATRQVVVSLSADEIRGISVGITDQIGKLIGVELFGIFGVMGRKLDTPLTITCERGGFPFVAVFALAKLDARAFLGAAQRQRRAVGKPPLLTSEEVVRGEADEDTNSRLDRIVELLDEQNAILERLVAAVRLEREDG